MEELRRRKIGPDRPGIAVLRTWPPPGLPDEPYPVLLPYTHPALLAGREQDVEEIRVRLRMPMPVFGLGAASGTGKSSFLLGGLVPELRSSGKPVAVVRHPQEPGVARRLLNDLLDGVPGAVSDDDWRLFVERLAEVERLSGEVPLLVLDQFEEVLREDAAAARGRVGALLASTAQRRPGIDKPRCRWLLTYRNEHHGGLLAWLGDVLSEAGEEERIRDELSQLPHDLSGQDRFCSLTLAPLATKPPGLRSGGDAALAEATRIFQAAIEKPLELRLPPEGGNGSDGGPRYRWRFAPGHAERLARAFAQARLARPGAPLAPELQVVLAHLLARAGDDGVVTVPERADELVEDALSDHLRRALEAAFPAGTAHAGTGRARALLALHELAGASGGRAEGLPADDLAKAIGPGDAGGMKVLERLATPLTRLVVFQSSPQGLRCALSHDRIAEAVVRMVEEEGRRGRLVIDADLLALRRFVILKTALHGSQTPVPGEGRRAVATRIPRRHYRRIAAHAEALLWNDERRRWWTASQKRRRADLRRSASLTAAAMAVLLLVSWGTWSWVGQRSERQALLDQVVKGEPWTALLAFERLAYDPPRFSLRTGGLPEGMSAEELFALVRQRETPMDIFGLGPGGIAEGERSSVVLRAVESALPWVAETPDSAVLIASLVWAIDFGPGRDPRHATQAGSLRDRVLKRLRELRPPPPIADDDEDWVLVPAGTFLMGSPEGEWMIQEHPQHEVTLSSFRIQRHEVTNAEYRRLAPDHPGADDVPAADLSWHEAYTYASWLGGRLPTEAEWEYAARAGCPHSPCSRDGLEADIDAVAWTLRNSVHPELRAPSAVMRLEPNPWGLYDMLGNVWEWTTDGYAPYPPGPRIEPWVRAGAGLGAGRVARGGGVDAAADWSRVASRSVLPPSFENGQGCRVVLPGTAP